MTGRGVLVCTEQFRAAELVEFAASLKARSCASVIWLGTPGARYADTRLIIVVGETRLGRVQLRDRRCLIDPTAIHRRW